MVTAMITTPVIGIPEIKQALGDEELLAVAFADAVDAMAQFAISGRSVFHATVLLDDLRRRFEERANRQ